MGRLSEAILLAKEEFKMRGIRWGRAILAVMSLSVLLVAVGCPPPGAFGGGGSPVVVGSVANGHIVGPGHRIRYPLTVSVPRTVTFYVQGRGLDPTVRVYNAAGGQIGFNDDGGNGLDSQLMLTLMPGSYIVEVAGYGSSVGPFTLTIN